jgi:hypothetical protein
MESVMRSGLMSSIKIVLVVCFILTIASDVDARRPKAVKGKTYKLTKDHGPWMIMVASFHTPPDGYVSKEGLTPEEAADALVYELRKKGFPAYVYKREQVVEKGTLRGRSSKIKKVKYTSDHGGFTVIAGNFKSAESKNAKKALKWIKKYQPKFLSEVDKSSNDVIKLKSGGILKRTPGRKTPLSRAFLTINPMLTPAEVQVTKDRPLLLKLNSGSEYSLLKNRGKFTVTVASFRGTSKTKIGNKKSKNPFKVSNSLDKAGLKAWELVKTLRANNVDAYVFHDKYKSIVTVGSFDSETDSGVSNTIEKYRAKEIVDKKTGQKKMQPEYFFKQQSGNQNAMYWIFDPQPQLLLTPKLRKALK